MNCISYLVLSGATFALGMTAMVNRLTGRGWNGFGTYYRVVRK